jgi:hypothetical protein
MPGTTASWVLGTTAECDLSQVVFPGMSVRHGSFDSFTKLTKLAKLTKKEFLEPP